MIERPIDSSAVWWSRDRTLGVGHFKVGDVQLTGSQPHCHSQYAFIIGLGGRAEFFSKGRHDILSPGEFIVHNPGQVHQSLYGLSSCSEDLTIYVDPIILQNFTSDQPWLWQKTGWTEMFLGKYALSGWEGLMEELVYELQRTELYRDALLYSLVTHIVVRAMREVGRPTRVRNSTKESSRLHVSEFSQVTNYMESRSFSNFSLEEARQLLRTSKSRFDPLFRNCTGRTPTDFFNRVLVKRAQLLLQVDRYPVKEVALGLGFRDISYFCRLFRGVVGASPAAYKELPPILPLVPEARTRVIAFSELSNSAKYDQENKRAM